MLNFCIASYKGRKIAEKAKLADALSYFLASPKERVSREDPEFIDDIEDFDDKLNIIKKLDQITVWLDEINTQSNLDDKAAELGAFLDSRDIHPNHEEQFNELFDNAKKKLLKFKFQSLQKKFIELSGKYAEELVAVGGSNDNALNSIMKSVRNIKQEFDDYVERLQLDAEREDPTLNESAALLERIHEQYERDKSQFIKLANHLAEITEENMAVELSRLKQGVKLSQTLGAYKKLSTLIKLYDPKTDEGSYCEELAGRLARSLDIEEDICNFIIEYNVDPFMNASQWIRQEMSPQSLAAAFQTQLYGKKFSELLIIQQPANLEQVSFTDFFDTLIDLDKKQKKIHENFRKFLNIVDKVTENFSSKIKDQILNSWSIDEVDKISNCIKRANCFFTHFNKHVVATELSQAIEHKSHQLTSIKGKVMQLKRQVDECSHRGTSFLSHKTPVGIAELQKLLGLIDEQSIQSSSLNLADLMKNMNKIAAERLEVKSWLPCFHKPILRDREVHELYRKIQNEFSGKKQDANNLPEDGHQVSPSLNS